MSELSECLFHVVHTLDRAAYHSSYSFQIRQQNREKQWPSRKARRSVEKRRFLMDSDSLKFAIAQKLVLLDFNNVEKYGRHLETFPFLSLFRVSINYGLLQSSRSFTLITQLTTTFQIYYY